MQENNIYWGVKVKNQVNKTNHYTVKDTSLMFILAIFLPYLIYFTFSLVVQIFFGESNVAKFLLTGTAGSFISSFIIQISILCGVFIVSKKRNVNFRKANNINFKLDYKKVLICIAIGLVALFGFNWFSDMITVVLSKIGYNVSISTSLFGATQNFWLLLVALFVMAIMPALCEELSMRGVILGGLKSLSYKKALLICALMFMILHMSLEQCIYQFILGLVLAFIVYNSGNIIYAIILHFFNNATVLVVNFIVKDAWVTKYTIFWDYFLPIIIALGAVGVIVLLCKLFKKLCHKKQGEIIENLAPESFIENTNKDIQNSTDTRDFAPAKIEYFDDKGALTVSVFIGVFTWIVTIVAGFLI